MYDSIVIGIGPAGISASIYLKRFNLDVLCIGKDNGALEIAEVIENYYSKGRASGRQIVEDGIKQAIEIGVLVNKDEVLAIEYADDGFLVVCKKGKYMAKTVVIATGKSRNTFSIAKKYEGKGVSYCATCDGFFYKNKKLALIGYNDYMLHELNHLYNMTKDITIFTNGHKLEVENKYNLNVITEKITDFYGDEKFSGIKINEKNYDFDGCFIALGSANAVSLAKHLGLEITPLNDLKVDEKFMTNIPGIFACGDVVGGMQQIVKAASDGAICASNISKYIRGIKK